LEYFLVGPIVADGLYQWLGFTWLNVFICLSNVIYAPLLIILKNVYKYKPFSEVDDVTKDVVHHCEYPPESAALRSRAKQPPAYLLDTIKSADSPPRVGPGVGEARSSEIQASQQNEGTGQYGVQVDTSQL